MLFENGQEIDVANCIARGDQYEVTTQESLGVQVSHGVAQRAAVLISNGCDDHLAPSSQNIKILLATFIIMLLNLPKHHYAKQTKWLCGRGFYLVSHIS